MALIRCSSGSGGGGVVLNLSNIDGYIKNGTYTRTVEVDISKDYLIYSYVYSSSSGLSSYKLYSLFGGEITLVASSGTQSAAATISGTTLQVKYSSSNFVNGYVVVQLD